MKRREFIAATAALLVSQRLRAEGTPRRIGFFGFLDPIDREAWRTGLRERGWIEGKNLLIEYRSYAETPDRMPTLAAELVDWEGVKPSREVCRTSMLSVTSPAQFWWLWVELNHQPRAYETLALIPFELHSR